LDEGCGWAFRAELLKAHKDLDNAVLKLYGLSSRKSEAEIVAVLFEKYQELVEKQPIHERF